MANVRNPFERQHIANLAAYVRMIDEIFRQATQEAASIGAMVQNIGFDESDLFSFEKYPYTKARIDRLMSGLAGGVQTTIVNGINAEWTLANNKNSELARRVFGDSIGRLTQAQYRRYFSTNDAAREAFLARKEQGLNLSERVWNYANGFKSDMELGLDVGIRNGVSADEMSRELRQYLRHPDKLFRRVRDEHGDLVLSKRAQDFHPGQGVYRSSYMNARRLTATETNIAYRTADYERAQQLDFIVGIEVKLSNNHNCKGVPAGMFYDICDELQGRYPKDFKFTGWHPHCYDDKSEVYTKDGWKLFKDVKDDDLILSLNQNTRDLEYVGILLNIKRQHKGRMIHFHNRSYSQLVTPEHEVLCVSKQDGRTFRRIKAEECGNSQPIYRSSEWKGRKIAKVIVGKHNVKYEHFARFMGYWLSDGSLGHKYAIAIAQQDDDRSRIYDCIAAMGMNPRYNGGKIEFNDKEWYEYLRQFGKSAEKFVPKEIKESDKDGIKVFLDAFISCDGHVRKAKPFVGNRGSLCVPTEDERVYFTTSVRMADDIGELILKTGHRPSFKVNHTGGRKQVFRNGEYTINHDVIVISECRSQCATQYKKDIVDYDGMVYDLTLEQNNTMYIRREGKCFWGSNCRCHVETILKTEEELMAENRAILNGEDPSQESVNRVADVPQNFKEWLEENKERAAKHYSMPYFIKDNRKYIPAAIASNYGSKLPYDTLAEYTAAMMYNKKHAGFSAAIIANNRELSQELPVVQGKIMNITEANEGKCNPMYGSDNYEELGYRHNCQTCTVTYELRRRGFDVKAKPNPLLKGYNDYRDFDQFAVRNGVDWTKRFLNTDGKPAAYTWSYDHGVKGTAMSKAMFIENQTQAPGRYEVYCEWKKGGAHVYIVERTKEGELLWYDPQTKKKGSVLDFFDTHIKPAKHTMMAVLRIDDKLINPKFAPRFLKASQ